MVVGKTSWCAIACFMQLSSVSGLTLQAMSEDLSDKVGDNTYSQAMGQVWDEEWDSTFSKIPPAKLPQRPMFLFIHLEKSAGSFLSQLFLRVLPWNMLGYHYPEKSIANVPDSYFVISSIRNPCSFFVSHWSYCCEKFWANGTLGKFDTAAKCGEDDSNKGRCPQFSGNLTEGHRHPGYTLRVDYNNKEGFLKKVMGPQAGKYQSLFDTAFRNIGPDRVNCWVHVENLEHDTRKCLLEYEQFSGYKVKWEIFDASWKKSIRNSGNHEDWQAYYTPEAESNMLSNNAFIFDNFGYNCSTST